MTVFVYSAGKLIAEYSTATPEPNPTTKWTVTDQLGSPRILVNSLGEVVSRRDFMPFGEELTPDGTHRTASLKYNFGDNVRQKFTGYQKDEETQLDFAEARMYQNLHGRFTAVDPLVASGKSAAPQTFNRYVYVINNPLVLVDPDGLQVATASGRVFRKGGTFRIYRGDKPESGFEPVAGTINTTTTIRGVAHHWQIRPNGWTVGNRVDGAVAAPAAPPLVTGPGGGDSRVSRLMGSFNQGFEDIKSGSAKGVGNFFIDNWNAGTDMILNSRGGLYFPGGSNPFAIERFPVFSATEARWSIGFQGGLTLAPTAAAAPFAASGSLSVVPQTSRLTNPVPSTLARVIPGDGPFPTLGPPGAGDVFVTAADDIAGMNAGQLSTRLAIPPSPRFTVIEFPTPASGIASPINRTNPLFVGSGRTSGGAREFVIPNGPVPCNAIVRTVC